MSVASTLRSRSALWHDVIDSFGYRAVVPRSALAGLSELRVRAVRPQHYGGPAAVIDVHELWVSGSDPDGLGLEHEGCHLLASSWHAQITATGDLGAERLDLDRAKTTALVIHRHPHGEPNEVRVRAAPLIVPVQWLEHVERLICDCTLPPANWTKWTLPPHH